MLVAGNEDIIIRSRVFEANTTFVDNWVILRIVDKGGHLKLVKISRTRVVLLVFLKTTFVLGLPVDTPFNICNSINGFKSLFQVDVVVLL